MVVCRLAAQDCLSFSTIAQSKEIQLGLQARGLENRPRSRQQVAKMVHDKANQVRQEISQQVQEQVDQDKRFSLTTDEYTSGRNRRYMTINVHLPAGLIHSLGLIRVHGSMPAEKAFELASVVSRPRGRNKVCRHKTQDGCRLLYSVSEGRLKGKGMENNKQIGPDQRGSKNRNVRIRRLTSLPPQPFGRVLFG
jgi:hypothetical protein